MLKIIGLAALFCSVSGIGVLAGSAIKERVKCLTEFRKIVDQFEIYTQYINTDIFETMRRINARQKSELLTRLLTHKADWGKEAIMKELTTRNEADREMMLEFFTAIGTSDLSGQVAVCKKAACQTAVLLEEANAQLSGKAKMYKSLGLCAGLAAVIFFI